MNILDIWQVPLILLVIYTLYIAIRSYLKNRKTEYEFTSIINHTFRTPLTRISWAAKELGDIELSKEERISHSQNISNATSKLLEIIDLIVGARDIKNNPGVYLLKETSFRDLVERSIEKYRGEINKKNIVFNISSFNNIPFIIIDRSKISFVVDTLIENAITYTKNSGGISIDCVLRNNKLIFYVADTGIGLSLKDKFKIFTKFYRGKRAIISSPDGMGLRLYLSKHIMRNHKGKIYAKSKGGDKGSVFFLELPI